MDINTSTEANSVPDKVAERTKRYIRDSIERYLPVGTDYIIVDQDFNIQTWQFNK